VIRFNHFSPLRPLALASALALAAACTTPGERAPTYSATSAAYYDPLNRPLAGLTRAQVLKTAIRQAREQILTQAKEMKLSDGRTLSDLAIVDPYVKAMLDDTVRAARIVDRTYSDEGMVTVTVSMQLTPLFKMIEHYPQHSIY